MIYRKIRLTIFVFCVILGNLFAQDSHFTVLDSKTMKPVAFAHLLLKPLSPGGKEQSTISDLDGRAVVNFTGQSELLVSYVGYKTYTDTIRAGESISILLHPSAFNVDEVVVTGQLEPKRADQSIYKIKVINSKEIEYRAASNLQELMTTELKFRVFNDGVLGSSLSIQGLSGNNIKILVDGIPMIGREGGNIDLNQMNLSNIDHVEIIEGPLSVIYGSNSLAGAINLITKKNDYFKWKSVVNAYYESVGVYNLDANLSQRFDHSSYNLSLGRYFNQEFDINPEVRSTLWKPKEQYFGDLQYRYDLGKNHFDVHSAYFRELMIDKGNPRPPYGEKVNDTWLRSNRSNNSLNYDRQLAKDKKLSFTLNWSAYKRINEKYEKDLTTLEQVAGTSDTTTSHALITRGIWYNFQENNKLNYQFGYDINYESGSGSKIEGNKKEISDLALFWSAQYKVNQKLEFQPGLRASYNTSYKSPVVPSLNMKWQAFDFLNIRASYVRGFRSPSIKELYLEFFDSNHNIRGNPDLESEFGHNFNLSFILNTDKLSKIHYTNLQFDTYYNRMHNNIELAVVDPDVLYYSYVNIANFATLGGFFQFDYKFYPHFSFSFGAGRSGFISSLDDKSFSLSEAVYGTDLTSSLQYTFIRYNLDINVFYKYNGKLPRYFVNDDGNIEISYLQQFHTLDLSVVKQFYQNRLSVSFGAKNLFDNYLIDSAGVGGAPHSGGDGMPVSWGRTYFVKLKYNLQKF